MDKLFSVNEWGSNPDTTDNDDCWTGLDFATLEEALADFNRDENRNLSTRWVCVDGPGVHAVRKLAGRKTHRDDAQDWKRELAMEAGMLHGVDAFNDEMGF